MKTITHCGIFGLLCLLLTGCEQGGFDPNEPGLLVPKTVETDLSLRSVSVNGTQLHSEAYGNPADPMLVILHGGPGADYRYLLNCTKFANQGFYVVFYDQRGSGLSKRHPKTAYSIEIMLDDLKAVIAYYRNAPSQKVFLLGHSWGGMLATAYINTYPTQINGAIIAEPGGFVWQDVIDYVGRSQDFRFLSETLNDATYADQFLTANEDQHELLDYKFGLMATADGAKDSPIGNEGPLPFWRSGAIVNRALFERGEKEAPDWTTHLSQFSPEVLFVYSQNNKAYGLGHAQKVSSAYPRVQLVKIEDTGHDMLSFAKGWSHFFPVALNYLNSLK